jgi:hypothetical protein
MEEAAVNRVASQAILDVKDQRECQDNREHRAPRVDQEFQDDRRSSAKRWKFPRAIRAHRDRLDGKGPPDNRERRDDMDHRGGRETMVCVLFIFFWMFVETGIGNTQYQYRYMQNGEKVISIVGMIEEVKSNQKDFISLNYHF